jgi:hypothetical protein
VRDRVEIPPPTVHTAVRAIGHVVRAKIVFVVCVDKSAHPTYRSVADDVATPRSIPITAVPVGKAVHQESDVLTAVARCHARPERLHVEAHVGTLPPIARTVVRVATSARQGKSVTVDAAALCAPADTLCAVPCAWILGVMKITAGAASAGAIVDKSASRVGALPGVGRDSQRVEIVAETLTPTKRHAEPVVGRVDTEKPVSAAPVAHWPVLWSHLRFPPQRSPN